MTLDRATDPLDFVYDYCLSNADEINDGVVSLTSSNLYYNGYDSILLDRFHITLPYFSGISEYRNTGKIVSLFFKNQINYTSVKNFLINNEGFYSHNGNSDSLPTEFLNKGGIIINLFKSEVNINDNSLVLRNNLVNYQLEKNKFTNRWYFVSERNNPGSNLDFTTSMPIGNYNLIINNQDSQKQVNILNGRFNLAKIDLDIDRDGFDLKQAGGSDCNDYNSLIRPNMVEKCNELDDNCDNIIDEPFVDKRDVCFQGIGECRNNGFMICSQSGLNTICSAVPKNPSVEICDLKDNNCNGIIDDGLPTLINGSDIGECKNEIKSCINGSYQIIQPGIISTVEICDGKDNDCDSEIDEGEICVPKDIITINSPQKSIFNSKKIQFNITLNYNADKISYLDNSKEKTLCNNCKDYGNEKIKLHSFSEGFHNLTFKTIKNKTILNAKSLSFIVDGKDPKISKESPKSKSFINISTLFYYGFDEDNPQISELYINNSRILIKFPFYLDKDYFYLDSYLNDYNGQTVEYYFILRDIANNTDVSKKIKVAVDTSLPIINSLNYSIDKKNVKFIINVTEVNLNEINYLDYIDNTQKSIRLCSKLKNGICEIRKSFNVGNHSLSINVLDKAGNLAKKDIHFMIDHN